MKKECFHKVSFTDEEGQVVTSMVPVVQELFRQGFSELPPKFRQLHPPVFPSSPTPAHLPPVIDMRNLRPDSDRIDRAAELSRLAGAAKDWGLFAVMEHGVPPSLVASLREVVEGFFHLSFGEKKESVGSFLSVDNLGYGRSFVKSENQRLDWIDRLAMRVFPREDNPGLHVWPHKPPRFRQVMQEYAEAARRVCNELLQALAEALSLPRHSFLHFFHPSQSVMNVRVNYYPPCPEPELALGLTPHSDMSGLTLLAQLGPSDGLQVLRDGRWATLGLPPGALLVNAGDLLEIMSNGAVHSPWHRVVTNRDVERISIAVFYLPHLSCEIEPVESGCDRVQYEKVVVGDYLEHYYRVSPTKEKEAILFAKRV